LLFLLLFGAYVCREAFCPLSATFVRTAVEAIEANSEPSLVNALARYNRVRLAHHLQLSLRHDLDEDGDGSLSLSELNRLRDFGLEPEQLQKKSIHASLPNLIDACHRAGLLPRSYTVSTARRGARFAAVGEVEQMKKPIRAEIDGMLTTWQMPDYSRLETWKRGGLRFLQWVRIPVYWLGRPRTVAAWLASCFFVSLMATSFLHRRRLATGLLVGCILSAPFIFPVLEWLVLSLWYSRSISISCSGIAGRTYLYMAIGFLCLSMACAGYGARVAGGKRTPRLYFFVGTLGLGIALLAWCLLGWLVAEGWRPDSELPYMLLAFWTDWDKLLFLLVPGWVKYPATVLGGVSLIIGILGLTGLSPFGRRAKRSASVSARSKQEEESE